MANNAENDGQTSTSNENDKKYQEALQELNDAICNVEKDIDTTGDYTKRKKISRIVFDFIKQNFPKNINSTELINITEEIIKTHPRFARAIIRGFKQSFILKEREFEDIDEDISEIISDNKESAFEIMNGFIQGLIKQKPGNIKEIAPTANQHRTNTSTNSSNKQLLRKDKQDKEDAYYYSSQPSYPSTDISEKGKGIIREPSTKADQEKTGGPDAKSNKTSEPEQNKNSNNGKPEYDSTSDSEEKNESFTDKRHKKQNKQGDRSR